MNQGLIILMVCLLVSVSQAEVFVNGGFETGDLTGWDTCIDPGNVVCVTPWAGSGSGGGNQHVAPPVTENPAAGATVTADFLDGFESGHFGRWTTAQSDLGHDNFLDVDMSFGAINPNSGNFMASIPQTTATPMNVEKVLSQAGPGTLTGYLSIESFHANYSAGLEFVASDGSSGAAILVNRAGNNRVEYRLDGGDYVATGITATTGVWYRIQFVVDPAGVDGFWNGQALFLNHNSPTKDVSKILIGSRLNTLRCFYDDVSFPFPQTQPPDPAESLSPPVLQDNGEPFFVLGYYAHETYPPGEAFKYDNLYATYASQSINTVLHWGSNWASPLSAQTAAADSALAQNLKYIAMLHHFAVIDDPAFDESLIDDQVDNLLFKPALFGWYLADEPQLSDSAVYPPRLQMLYDRVRAHDVGLHPQFVVFVAPVESYLRHEEQFSATHDVMMNDDYPVRDGTPEFGNDMWSVASWTRQQVLLCKINGSKQAQINVTQATGVNGWGGFRLPTFNEQRYLSYAPIVEGSRGLLWWDWGNLGDPAYVQARADYRADVLGPIATEISALAAAIVSNSTAVTVTSDRDVDTFGHGIEDVTYLFGKEDPNRLILIAVNHTPGTLASVTFTLTGGALGSADGARAAGIEVAYEGRVVQRQPVSGNTWTLTDTFTPYDVNVYVLTALDPPADCSEAITQGYGLATDYNADCHVSFADYGLSVVDWLLCIHPEDPQCYHPWQP